METIEQFFRSGVLPMDRPFTFFEIGAHVGQHTRWFLEIFPRADLWIFEPDPRNAGELRRLGLDKRTRLFEVAVGDRDDTMTMNLSSGILKKGLPEFSNVNWTFSSSLKKPKKHLERYPWVKFAFTARVRVARLDSLKAEHGFGDIEFLWADIQGAEDMMIAGGQETLARTRYVYTEFGEVEYYEGQIGLQEIRRRLPGGERQWEVVFVQDDDVLLKNTSM
jgi:2-O-methyltransferase